MDRDSGSSQQDLIKQSKSPPSTANDHQHTTAVPQPWYSNLSLKAALFLTPALITLVLLYLSSSSFNSLRSSVSLITVALPSDSYHLALDSVGASTPADSSVDALLRRQDNDNTSTAAGYLTLTAWGWCAGQDTDRYDRKAKIVDGSSATCSENKLFFVLPDKSEDVILNSGNFSKLLLRMLSIHVLASITSLIAVGLVGWHLWQCRQSLAVPILPGWLQYGPLLATSILATMAWAVDVILLHSLRGKMTSTTIISGSGITLTGLSVITAWITLIITAIPSIISKIRQQREWANNAYYRDDIESGEIEEDMDWGEPEEVEKEVKEKTVKKKPAKKSNRHGWFSRRRGDSSHRSRSDDRRYEDKRSAKRHPTPSSRSRSSRDRHKRDKYYR